MLGEVAYSFLPDYFPQPVENPSIQIESVPSSPLLKHGVSSWLGLRDLRDPLANPAVDQKFLAEMNLCVDDLEIHSGKRNIHHIYPLAEAFDRYKPDHERFREFANNPSNLLLIDPRIHAAIHRIEAMSSVIIPETLEKLEILKWQMAVISVLRTYQFTEWATAKNERYGQYTPYPFTLNHFYWNLEAYDRVMSDPSAYRFAAAYWRHCRREEDIYKHWLIKSLSGRQRGTTRAAYYYDRHLERVLKRSVVDPRKH